MIKFQKMHGLGNDFIIVDERKEKAGLTPDMIKTMSHRRLGIGCDQFIVLEPSDKADLFMRIYNGDASQSEACGNATRCVAHKAMKEQGTQACTIETIAGLLQCRLVENDLVEVNMGQPQLAWDQIPLARDEDTLNLPIAQDDLPNPAAVAIGNPHCIFFIEDAEAFDIEHYGPIYEHHELFPNRTNVEFAQILSPTRIRLRVWERSAGITMACGSATCATITAAVRKGLTERKADIILDGGTLNLEWREDDNCICMTGPVAYVFEGTTAL